MPIAICEISSEKMYLSLAANAKDGKKGRLLSAPKHCSARLVMAKFAEQP